MQVSGRCRVHQGRVGGCLLVWVSGPSTQHRADARYKTDTKDNPRICGQESVAPSGIVKTFRSKCYIRVRVKYTVLLEK